VRPADANETATAWLELLTRHTGPAGIALSRQNLPVLPREIDGFAGAEGVRKGAYVLVDAEDGTPDVILIATGSEVHLAVEARTRLAAEGVQARVISAPSLEWFAEQDDTYRESVLPSTIKARVSVEAGSTLGWHRIVGDAGRVIGIDHFGASASAGELQRRFGFTVDAVVAAAHETIEATA
ncbi:transketolase-like TK C-terminal-containing protein, partial [Microbacterium sp. Leaf347]